MRRYRRKRSFSRRRSTTRRSRYTRRRPLQVTLRRRKIRPTYNRASIIKVKRRVNFNLVGPTTAGVGIGRAIDFALSDVTATMNFDGMYDNYRIHGVKVTFFPPATEITATSQDPGRLYYQVDYDDSVVPTNYYQFINRSNIKMRRLVGKPFSIFFKPKAQGFAYDPGNTTGPSPSVSPAATINRNEWLDTAFSGVKHYGLKLYWSTNTAVGFNMEYDVQYYLEFKNLINMLGS